MTLLIGRYEYALDAKNRLAVPPKFRELLAAQGARSVFITSGMEGCLYLYLPSQWRRLVENGMQAFTMEDKEKERAFKRKFFSEATEAELDGAGRVLVPQYLKAHAGLKGKVLVQGAGNRAEIWDGGRWNAYEKNKVAPAYRAVSKSIEL
ncbi:MAG: division/cell wall cluster transcriptional repressor MraZ [Elusimicrobia bacterium]|nr:division/cell wall cluster transcriptional repressor MraZ [Elusimicrobiota bacterium]